MATAAPDRGFFAFYREYAKTGVHAASAATMTGFGLLATVHRAFVAVAIAAYALPPIYLYLTRDAPPGGTDTDPGRGSSSEPSGSNGSPGPNEPPGPDTTARTGERAGHGEPNAARPDRESGAEIGETAAVEDREPPTRATEPRDDRDEPAPWIVADAPTDADLFDAAATDEGAFVAGDGGVLLADRGDGWSVALSDGPGAAGEPLRGVAAASDGRAVWVAGDNGALGVYRVATGRHTDYSAPDDYTDSWTDVAVTGSAGEETVYLVNGSGAVLRGRREGGGEPAWDEPVKPGSGSSMSAAAFADGSVGFCCDTNATVFRTEDGGDAWEPVGIDGAGALSDVAPVSRSAVTATDEGGHLHRYDGGVWTPTRASDGSLWAVARRSDRGLAVGDGGTILELTSDTRGWEPVESPVDATLRGVGLSAERAIVVGDGGTVVERAEGE